MEKFIVQPRNSHQTKPETQWSLNELDPASVNQVFLEIMQVIQTKQNPNDELFNSHFVYHDKPLSALLSLIRELKEFQLDPQKYQEKSGWLLPHSHSLEELKTILGAEYIEALTGLEYYFGNLEQSGAFIPHIDKNKQNQETISSLIAIGSERINPKPHDIIADFLQDFNEKEKLQMMLSHELGHFIQLCFALRDKNANNYHFSQIDCHQSSYPKDTAEFLESFLSDTKPAQEFDNPELHRNFQKFLFKAAKEIYADSFAILLSTQLNDFSMPLHEVFYSFLSSRQKLAQPVFLEHSFLFEQPLKHNLTKALEKEKIVFDMSPGDIAHQTEFGVSYLMRQVNSQSIDTQELNIEKIDKLCQNAMVYGITQLIYEASLTYPEYGQYIAQIQTVPSQGSLWSDKKFYSAADLFTILSYEDKEKTQKRVSDYQNSISTQAGLEVSEQIELYQRCVIKTQFVGPHTSIFLNQTSLPQQEALFDKIKTQRQSYVLENLNGNTHLEVPKPITLRRS